MLRGIWAFGARLANFRRGEKTGKKNRSIDAVRDTMRSARSIAPAGYPSLAWPRCFGAALPPPPRTPRCLRVELLAGGGEPAGPWRGLAATAWTSAAIRSAVPGGRLFGRTTRSGRQARARVASLGRRRQVGHCGGPLRLVIARSFTFPVSICALTMAISHTSPGAVSRSDRQRLGHVAVRNLRHGDVAAI